MNRYHHPETLFDNLGDPEYELAGRFTRLGAALLDALFIYLIYYPVSLIFFGFEATFNDNINVTLREFILQTGIYLILNWASLARTGQTIGKKMVDIKIVDERCRVPSFAKLITLRQLLPSIIGSLPIIGLIFGLIDVLFIFSDERRCVHDYFADTYVVKATPIPSSAPKPSPGDSKERWTV